MTTDYSQITKNLDKEMRQMIEEYQKLKQNNDRKVDLLLKRIRIKHPIFHMMTNSAFKFLMEQSALFKLKPG